MSALWKSWVTKSQNQLRVTIKLIALLSSLGINWCPAPGIQKITCQTGTTPMSRTTDVTHGPQHLLQDDDIATVQVSKSSHSELSRSLLGIKISDSEFSGIAKKIDVSPVHASRIQLLGGYV